LRMDMGTFEPEGIATLAQPRSKGKPTADYLMRWKILPQRMSVMNGNGRSESS
jgi:hypothetical protein